ncbi:MAG TPA: ankyrin repeat domain-containing protein [Propionibacterium sp.]|nr:ankyrin repeat domain-containing protein [Propionibacterium sp.]
MTDVPDGTDPVALANWLFDLARQGDAARLGAYVDAGAPVDLTDAEGNTLLMLASYHDQPATVRELVARGADVDALNARGQSPLAGAVFKQADEVVRVLVEAGADPDAGTPTARATAQMFGRTDLFG